MSKRNVFEVTITDCASSKDAFKKAKARSLEYPPIGEGTIHDKTSFIEITVEPDQKISECMSNALGTHAKISKTEGPAGCIKLPDGYLFFGWSEEITNAYYYEMDDDYEDYFGDSLYSHK